MRNRTSGILLHITSLPGREGIGTLGKNACKWIDFIRETNQRIWQILPLGPVGFANSPYNCFSAFAGNPLMIDLQLLAEEDLLSEKNLMGIPRFDTRNANFQAIEKWKTPLLRKACKNYYETRYDRYAGEYERYLDENGWWLNDYALFMAARTHFGNIPWQSWPDALKYRSGEGMAKYRQKLAPDIDYHIFLQFVFFRQWKRLHDYAKSSGIQILGDMPLYVGADSADVWANTDIFRLDSQLMPTTIAGVPPDYFSETGQLWGNPVFNWEKLREQEYHWWMARIHFNLRMFDLVRIDHFRGLESFWSVPATAENAINGEWLPAGGHEILRLLRSQIGELPLIAEDLGIITPEVEQLRQTFDLPGMKVLQFAFTSDEKNEHLPHNYDTNCLAYTGTHDNDTTWGWLKSAGMEERKMALSYLRMFNRKPAWAMIELAWSSVAKTAIVPLQDLLELGAESRMNIPGVSDGNWGWRFRWEQLRGRHRRFLSEITKRYNRNS
jgi:4-alpha-glucanotransferase